MEKENLSINDTGTLGQHIQYCKILLNRFSYYIKQQLEIDYGSKYVGKLKKKILEENRGENMTQDQAKFLRT